MIKTWRLIEFDEIEFLCSYSIASHSPRCNNIVVFTENEKKEK